MKSFIPRSSSGRNNGARTSNKYHLRRVFTRGCNQETCKSEGRERLDWIIKLAQEGIDLAF